MAKASQRKAHEKPLPVVSVNGTLSNPEDAVISIFDRGFIYGDSLYEVFRTYRQKLFAVEEHLERLERSASLCKMTLTQPRHALLRECERTVRAFYDQPGAANKECYCRLIVTRGIGKIGMGRSALVTDNEVVIIVQALDPITPERWQKGLHLHTASRLRNDRRALDPAMKSGNYLNNLLAYLEAEENQRDDALLLNQEGHVTEGTTYNIYYIRRGIVATPPVDVGILHGITRHKVNTAITNLGIELREVSFPLIRLQEADEAFITSTLKEVVPITQLDGRKIGNGKPGPLTQKILQAFRKENIR